MNDSMRTKRKSAAVNSIIIRIANRRFTLFEALECCATLSIERWSSDDYASQPHARKHALGLVFPKVQNFNLTRGSLRATLHLAATLHVSELHSFAKFLLTDQHIRTICAGVMEDSCVSTSRLEKNLRRILQQFWEHLSLEATTSAEHAAVRFFQSGPCIWTIANYMLCHVYASADAGRSSIPRVSKDYNAAAMLYVSVSLQPNRLEPGFKIQSLAPFLHKSRALVVLKRQLQEFVTPSFSGALDSILRRFYKMERGILHQGLIGVSSVMSRIRYADPATVSVSNGYPSLVDRWKCHIEDISGMSWNWWPLREPLDPLKHDEVYLIWQCVSTKCILSLYT